jgi:hypothetical protein
MLYIIMPKKRCFTKTANDGHKYQGCATDKGKETEKKKVKKIKFIVKKKAEPDKKTKVKIKEKIMFKPSGNEKKDGKVVKRAKPKKKAIMSKSDFEDELHGDGSMGHRAFGASGSYYDYQSTYRNDYPTMANTERQMDMLSSYSQRQVSKQMYSHYKKHKNLKGFKLSQVYGKAF